MAGNWTAIIVNYNGAGFIEACMYALEASTLRPADIIVVDNGSTDDSLLEMNAFPRAQVLAQGRNLGFAGGANVGLDAVETDYAVVLNPDVEVDPSFGTELVRAFDGNPRLGAAGALLLYPDGQIIQHAGGTLERTLLTTSHLAYGKKLQSVTLTERDVDFVTGGAIGLRMDAAREIGGFDTDFSPVYYEDVDLCLRLRNNHWAVKFIPELRALHHEGVTLQREPAYYHHLHRNRIKFALKHLSPQEWATTFVPAEIERLRAEVQHSDDADWVTTSGANAIEDLARSIDGWSQSGLLSADILDEGRLSVAATGATWEVERRNPGSRIPLMGLFQRLINSLGPGQALDAALADQRAFNGAVVRALEAQDRINREQLATTLLLAVDLLGQLRSRDRT